MNGHFDLALRLIERGADPNIATDGGATPLFAALNLQWAPRARYPQPRAHDQQEATYLDVMEALLEAGAESERADQQPPLVHVVQPLLLGERRRRHPVLAGRLRHRRRGDEAADGPRRGSEHPDAGARAAAAQGRQLPGSLRTAAGRPRWSRRLAAPRGIGRRLRRGLRIERPPARAGRLDAVGEVPDRGGGRRRQRPRPRRLQRTAPCRRARRHRVW